MSTSKTASWATEAKEAGAAAAGVNVEAKSWPPHLQADVEPAASLMFGAAATCEGEHFFMSKFNLADEKECCICLKAEELGKLLALVSCGHRCVCAD